MKKTNPGDHEALFRQAMQIVDDIVAQSGPVDMDDDQFRAFLAKDGYTHIRRLDDGTWVALVSLIFATGLCMGLDRFGWARRYDYDDPGRAIVELIKLERGDQVPAGWIDRRPE